MVRGVYDYAKLDAQGEGRAAAERMEARAVEPASEALFQALVAPLLGPGTKRVLEVGAGPGALARRVAKAAPHARVFASDKSAAMVAYAKERAPYIEFRPWDANDEAAFPFDPAGPFDLILSSVMVPYLTDEQTTSLVGRLAGRLAPGGVLAFIEQDLQTDTLAYPDFDLLSRVFAKDARKLKRTLALGLRPVLRDAGLGVLPRASFLWTSDDYGPYLRDLLGRLGTDAVRTGSITEDERQTFGLTLEELSAREDFAYGLVYHRIAGRR
ncbi:MAG TPA: methyltransferase domain-containing protein [Polyangiaceae bacterium]